MRPLSLEERTWDLREPLPGSIEAEAAELMAAANSLSALAEAAVHASFSIKRAQYLSWTPAAQSSSLGHDSKQKLLKKPEACAEGMHSASIMPAKSMKPV